MSPTRQETAGCSNNSAHAGCPQPYGRTDDRYLHESALADDGYEYATLGLSPLSNRSEVEPFHSPLWRRLALGWVLKHVQRFYNFDGLDFFKAKLKPDQWEPVFAISNEPRVSFKTLDAIGGAFSGNATTRMVARGLGRAVATECRRPDQIVCRC
ncbi:MAG: phosphatidylglycerol lysyltransferase domain-containing protein [Pyrinomonadaceae bacterium]